MLTLVFITLYGIFGIAGGLTYRVLAARSQLGFRTKHWALLGAAVGCALLFARFVVNRRGLFGTQPESAFVVGAVLLLGGFIGAAWVIPWLRQRHA